MRAFLLLIAAMLVPAGPATAQTPAVRECLRLDATPPDVFGYEKAMQAYRAWAATCRQALESDPSDIRLKRVLARALGASGERAEEIEILRELGKQNHAEALFTLYDTFKSYDRSDVTKPQLVKREEAEAALRKSAELGHPYSILMLTALLDRGATVKRDNAEAIRWAERAIQTPAKDYRPIDMQVTLARLLMKSPDPEQRARGMELLEKLMRAGRGDAKAYYAIAIRASDPARARALLEEAMRGYGGYALPTLSDMLIKEEGGPADPKRAVSLLQSASYTPGRDGALGRLYVEGKVVPRDLQKGVELLDTFGRWDHEARLEVTALLAANPELRLKHPAGFLYNATEAADLDEPGARDALVALKLSQNAQFRDVAGGCALAARFGKKPKECGTN